MGNEEHTLLVVDDDEMNRDLLSRRLRRKGYGVAVAEGGRQALEAVARESIDLVLLDIMMPGIDGIEVLKRLRREHSQAELPIIMATAKGDSEDVVQALELGANDYVTKPLDFPVVLARVEAQLRTRAAAPRAPAAPAAPAGAGEEPRAAEIGPGKVLAGKYELIDELGSGTFGTVYRALHRDLQTEIALKVLRTGLASDRESLDRFRAEGAAACRVRHPNAVAVYDFGVTEAKVAYLAMELLEGASLDRELEVTGPLPLRRAAEILRPICDLLAEAHARGVVHRDIKPGNIFLHRRPGHPEVVKVLDFGIAKLVGETAASQQLTQDGMLIGTPYYMAPERLQNRPYDGRSDVYSLGVMLYLMLTGELPFQAQDGNLMALVLQHLEQPVPSPRAIRPELPVAVEGVIARALDKRPEHRPGALELAAELSRAAPAPTAPAAEAPRRAAGTPPAPEGRSTAPAGDASPGAGGTWRSSPTPLAPTVLLPEVAAATEADAADASGPLGRWLGRLRRLVSPREGRR